MEDENSIFPMEEALEMILFFNKEGIISYANAAARTKLGYGEPGGSEDGLRGRSIGEVFPHPFRDGRERTDYSLGGEQQKLVAYRRNKTCFPVEARIAPGRGGGELFVCMANDILEQEHLGREIGQIREEARQAAKAKSEFVANVTHELRTPVNGILGNVRELLGDVRDDRTKKALLLMERCCGDMNKIIDNILDFSKLDAGKFVLESRRFNIRNMVDYVREQHRGRIAEKGLDFFVTVSPQVPEYVIGDELRMVQILNNLLSNALKFTAVGKITLQLLRTARSGDKVELFFIVSDTGIGIGEEDRDKLFQSFSQVDASISRKYGGTGLGLSICKQLVELMGGRIEVESEKNRGSTFSFSVWAGADGEDASQPLSDDIAGDANDDIRTAFRQMARQAREEGDGPEDVRRYGTPENREALRRNLSKLILCVEMENWEKAEMFMEAARQLAEGAPPEVKRAALRLKMAIQKESYEKAAAEHEKLSEALGREEERDGEHRHGL